MRFDLRRPCPQCPFTRAAGGFLSADRAEEIASAVIHGNVTFTCHKSLSGRHQDEDETGAQEETYRPGGRDQHCAGALAFYDKIEKADHRTANAMLQIAQRLGLRDPRNLDPSAESQVYDSIEEMREAHERDARPTRTNSKRKTQP